MGWLCWGLHSDGARCQPQNDDDDDDDVMSHDDVLQCRYAGTQGERYHIGTYLDDNNLSMFTTRKCSDFFPATPCGDRLRLSPPLEEFDDQMRS